MPCFYTEQGELIIVNRISTVHQCTWEVLMQLKVLKETTKLKSEPEFFGGTSIWCKVKDKRIHAIFIEHNVNRVFPFSLYLYRGKNYAALVMWHIVWLRYITLKTACWTCKRIQQGTIFIHSKEKYVSTQAAAVIWQGVSVKGNFMDMHWR